MGLKPGNLGGGRQLAPRPKQAITIFGGKECFAHAQPSRARLTARPRRLFASIGRLRLSCQSLLGRTKLANLSLAFQHKHNILKGETMPDPRTDSSFQKYVRDDDFIALMKKLGYQ
jgi:hypothetical protein